MKFARDLREGAQVAGGSDQAGNFSRWLGTQILREVGTIYVRLLSSKM
jgi:hypothetical protein